MQAAPLGARNATTAFLAGSDQPSCCTMAVGGIRCGVHTRGEISVAPAAGVRFPLNPLPLELVEGLRPQRVGCSLSPVVPLVPKVMGALTWNMHNHRWRAMSMDTPPHRVTLWATLTKHLLEGEAVWDFEVQTNYDSGYGPIGFLCCPVVQSCATCCLFVLHFCPPPPCTVIALA